MKPEQQLYIDFIRAEGNCRKVLVLCIHCPFNVGTKTKPYECLGRKYRIEDLEKPTRSAILEESTRRYKEQWGMADLLEALI